MKEYITQKQAIAIAHSVKRAGDYLDTKDLCNAAIQAYRDSLVAGEVLPEPVGFRLPEPDIADKYVYFDAPEIRLYKEKLEAIYTADQLRQAIADALAKQDTRAPMFEFRECEDSQAMQEPDYEQSETYLRTQSELTKPQDHSQLVERIKSEFERLNVSLAKQVPQGNCEWSKDPDFEMGDTYDSSCGEKWSFIDGGPVENRVRFCQGCGKHVQLLAAAPDPKEAV